MSIKAIAKGNRKKGDKETLPILIQSVDVENTVDAQVACDHNISDGDTVYIDFEGGDKSRPIIVGVLYGQTEADALDDGDKDGNYDPSDPNAQLLSCGSTLAELACVIVAYGEHSGMSEGPKLTELKTPVVDMIPDKFYAAFNDGTGDAGGQSIGFRQWNKDRGPALYKKIYDTDPKLAKKKGSTGNYSDPGSVISKTISTDVGKQVQLEYAASGEKSGNFASDIKHAVQNGIKDNAILLFYCTIHNGGGTADPTMFNICKKMKKQNLDDFYKAFKNSGHKYYTNYVGRRKVEYEAIKLMEDAGWLKGSAGNLTNLADNGSDNEKTGWGYPIEDKEGKFYISDKFSDKNKYCIISHKKKKNEGKTVLAMYKGKVKEVSKDSGLVTMILETKEDNAKKNGKRKHYVQYMGLKSINVKKGDSVKKEQAIGKLGSEGLTLTVHKTKNSESTKVDPSIYIGTNPVNSGGFKGDPSKFTWWYQMNDGKYYNYNYGSNVPNGGSACCIFSIAMMFTSFSGNKNKYIPPKISNSSGTGIGQKWNMVASDGQAIMSKDYGKSFATKVNQHKDELRCTAKAYTIDGKLPKKILQSVTKKGGALLCNTHGVVGNVNYSKYGHFFNITGMTKSGNAILADPGNCSNAYYKYKDPGGRVGQNHGISTNNINIRYCVAFFPLN